MKDAVKKIVVLGLGALGSHAVLFLRNLDFRKVYGEEGPVYKIVGVDFDRVEHKNTQAQFHAKQGTSKGKAQSLQQTLQFLFGVKIDVIPHKLTKDNVDMLLGGAALVIECFDNGASRELVQSFVRERKIPCVHGAISADGNFGRVVWDDKFSIDHETGEGATCEDGEHLPFITLVSAHLARSVQEFLSTGRQMSFQVFSKSPSIFL